METYLDRRKLLGSAVLAGGALALGGRSSIAAAAGTPPAPKTEGENLDRIVKSGQLRVGIFLQYPPLQFRDAKTRQPKGLDVDIGNLLAQDMGVKIKFVDMDWNALIPGLYANQYDLINASMAATPTRALAVDFSEFLEQFNEILMVPKNSKIKTYADAAKPGTKITFSTGSTSDYAAHRFFPRAKLTGMDQIPSVLAVSSGQADAVVIEDVFAVPYVKKHPELRIVGLDKPLTGEPAAFGIQKGQQDLLDFLNTWVRYKRARRELQALFEKWGVSSS
jgi:ABC-type amino acid transport substrate-binding protein